MYTYEAVIAGIFFVVPLTEMADCFSVNES